MKKSLSESTLRRVPTSVRFTSDGQGREYDEFGDCEEGRYCMGDQDKSSDFKEGKYEASGLASRSILHHRALKETTDSIGDSIALPSKLVQSRSR